ncbi:MAG: acyl-CoA thioesterase II [Desulfuromonadales bacterium]|nr:acyl-CoA thioesterase II [Desulfuromonadales bacterium]
MREEPVAQNLYDLFELEEIEENLFRGRSQDLGLDRLFGGQVLGQALAAAERTVPDRAVHSFHAYFLLMGSDKAPIVYQVERLRDGRSFTTRHVVAIQKGKPLFSMTASFQVDEAGMEHQANMPDVPGPDEFPPLLEALGRMRERNLRLEKFLHEFPIEIRPVTPVNPYASGIHLPFSRVWMRAVGRLPDGRGLHQALLAYASDYGLITTAGLPHGVPANEGKFQEASLDHALWFHRDFRMDEWLLYVTDSPNLSNARGFTQGRIFTRDGKLVASVAQEGLIRERT